MTKQDYQNSIISSVTPKETMYKIARVSGWWAKDFEGKSEAVNDVFTVRFKNGDMYKMRVTEIVPETKVVWDVIDSYQGWHADHSEWNGTKVVWEIYDKDGGTEVRMTHVGLVPEFECYEACNRGWNYLIEESLQNLLDEGKGLPV